MQLSIALGLFPILFAGSLALPATERRGFSLGDLQNATLSGIANTIVGSIEDPSLTASRLEVVKGISDTSNALTKVSNQATSTGNTDVASFVAQGSQGVGIANQGVDNIGQALISNQTPSIEDQKNVAIGIKQAQDSISCMSNATVSPNDQLTSAISAAATAVGGLKTGGEGVIGAENRSFADLGLPDNFDTIPPNCTLSN